MNVSETFVKIKKSSFRKLLPSKCSKWEPGPKKIKEKRTLVKRSLKESKKMYYLRSASKWELGTPETSPREPFSKKN
jgi:hypothetical protein